MKELEKRRFEESGGKVLRPKIKLTRRTRIVAFIFSVMTILITAGIMRAANVYYDLDTNKIVMTESINQAGAGQVTFSGNVDATNGLDVTTANFTVGTTNFVVAPGTGNVTTKGTIGIADIAEDNYTYFQAGAQAVDVTYTLPTGLPAATGYSLVSSDAGVLSWAATVAGTAHPLLGSTAHSDTTTGTVARGDLITGQGASATWTRLGLGTTGKILRSDGTDAVWSATTFAEMGTINQLLFSSAANAVTGVTAGASGQLLVASATGVPTFVTMGTDATIAATGAITIAGDAVALGTDTTGNYVQSANTSALTGLTGGSTGSESAALTLAFDYSTALSGDPVLLANNIIFGTNGMIWEGATANTFETYMTLTDPTADNTITFPNKSGTVAMTSDVTSLGTGVLRGQVNIFGFDYPTQCSTSCDLDTYAAISRDIVALPNFPAVLTGKTRSYKLVVRYADDLTVNGNTTVQIWNTTTNLLADSFTIAGLAADGDLEKGKVFLSDDLTIPLAGDDWEVRVMVPAVGDVIRIYSLELAAYDID